MTYRAKFAVSLLGMTLTILLGSAAAYAADTATTPCKRDMAVPGVGTRTFVQSTASSDNVNVAAAMVWDEDCNPDNGVDGKVINRDRKGKTTQVMVALSSLPSSGCIYVYVNGELKSGTTIANLGNCP